MDVVFNGIDWMVGRIPQPWGGLVGGAITAIVLILLLRELAKTFGLDLAFRFKRSMVSTLPAQEPVATASAAPGALTKEEVLRRVADGVIDRPTAEWLFAQSGAAGEAGKEAFVDTVERIGVAPEPGEREALELLAKGDAKGALDQLSSVAAERSNPKLLQTLSVLAAPVDPQLGAEAFRRFTVATESRPLKNEDRLRLSYALPGRDDIEVGVIAGDLAEVRGVDAWVSSENDWLVMARQMDNSISATVRYLAARKAAAAPPPRPPTPEEGRFGGRSEELPLPLNDPMQQALRGRAYGRMTRRPMGYVKMTGAGELARTHGVKRVFHVVSVRAKPLGGVTPGEAPGDYVAAAVAAADKYNRGFLRLPFAKLRSIVVPLFGTGQGRLKPEETSDMLVDGLLRAAKAIADRGGRPSLTRLYLLAYASREYLPLRDSFEKRVLLGQIAPRRRAEPAKGKAAAPAG